MLDKPTAQELLEAVAAFLSEDVVPVLEGRRRFHALVAANVIRIVTRELREGTALDRADLTELEELLGECKASGEGNAGESDLARLTVELVRRIEAGEADHEPWRSRVLDYLKRSTARRLTIDNPKLLG